MSPRDSPKDASAGLRKEVKRACDRLHTLTAQLNGIRELSRERIRSVRAERKRAGRAMRENDPAKLDRALDSVRKMCETVAREIEDLGSEPATPQNPDGDGARENLDGTLARGDDGREFEQKLALVREMRKGASARRAIERIGIEGRAPRWARRVYQRYCERGIDGLLDGRKSNGATPSVMTTEVKAMLKAIWLTYRSAPDTTIHKKLRAAIRRENEQRDEPLPIPSYPTVWKELREESEHWKAIREGGLDLWDSACKPVAHVEIAFWGNQRWQGDHTRIETWIRAWENGEWVPRAVWLTAYLDAFSRAVPSFEIRDRNPDAGLLGRVLLHAIQRKAEPGWKVCGIPEVLQTDNGSDYTSLSFEASLAALHIEHDLDPCGYPERKGRIERWFRTLDSKCLRGLPGHMEAVGVSVGAARKRVRTFLTLPQLREEIQRWIVDEYHQTIHGETHRKPIELWEETVRLRIPEDPARIKRILLRRGETRVIRQKGLRFNNEWYWNPDLVPHLKREVEVRYDPDDLSVLLVFEIEGGSFVCEARQVSELEVDSYLEEVIQTRREYRKALAKRLREHQQEADRLQAALREEKDWQEAREEIEDARSDGDDDSPIPPEALGTEDPELEALMREMRGQFIIDEE